MPILTPDQVRIKRKDLEGFAGFSYVIKTPKWEGFAMLILYKIEVHNSYVIEMLKGAGFHEQDIFADIPRFYPYGFNAEEFPKECIRMGLGTIVLERIISDSREKQAALVLVDTKEEFFANLLLKKGFIDNAPYFYRSLR